MVTLGNSLDNWQLYTYFTQNVLEGVENSN